MDQAAIQELFQRFAAPLVRFSVLGSRQEAIEELARNFWMAMLAGPEAEAQVFSAMESTGSELMENVRRCYEEEMKPVVTPEQLAALRERYGI